VEIRNLISIADIDSGWWDTLYSTCRDILSHTGDYGDALRGKLLASLFFEPSTRTRFSFQSAMQRLGGAVFGFSNPNDSSRSKGESLADTIRMTGSYGDIIVMRSPLEGAARAASMYSEVPLINAGDGGHHHPTQTLTDLTTLSETRGKIENLNIGLCGDLKYGRTVHSLVYALALFPGIRFTLISPESLAMPEYMLEYMKSRALPFEARPSIRDALAELDVLYMTRIQKERFSPRERAAGFGDNFILDRAKLAGAKTDLTIMHPLPRVDEISPDVDSDSRARYFDQAKYGMYIRMALLLRLSKLGRAAPPRAEAFSGSFTCGNPACVTNHEPYLPRSAVGGACAYCDAKIKE
jgi:aspartate carbamoyltransferase catalytic subunit